MPCSLKTSRTHNSKKQGVALMGRNRTGPPSIVGRRTAHTPGRRGADRPHTWRPAG